MVEESTELLEVSADVTPRDVSVHIAYLFLSYVTVVDHQRANRSLIKSIYLIY